MTLLSEFLASVIRHTPGFRGKPRLLSFWMEACRPHERRRCRVGSSSLLCGLAIPYEAMVWLGQEEESDLRILRSLLCLGSNGLFVDVGANIGLWTVAAAESGARIAAFEPNPTTVRRLVENVQLCARSANIQVYPIAAGKVAGEIVLNCSDNHNISSVLPIAGRTQSCTVAMRSLDSFVELWPRVQGIKIDAEGFELAVVQGAEKLLGRDRPWMIIEFNPELAGTTTLGKWEVHRLLSTLGYRAQTMTPAVLVNGKLENDKLSESWTTRWYRNLFYSPAEK